MRLKKNDTVMIIAGKDKGKTGKIVKIDPSSERVYVQGCNMVMKTQKKRTTSSGTERKSALRRRQERCSDGRGKVRTEFQEEVH